jgi:Beta/Gamma crystallin
MENMNLTVEAIDASLNMDAATRLPEVVVYFHRNFGDPSFRTNLNVSYVGDAWNDQISAIVVVSGKWQFYRHRDFVEPMGQILGPGYYPWVADVGIENDHISSFRCLAPTD